MVTLLALEHGSRSTAFDGGLATTICCIELKILSFRYPLNGYEIAMSGLLIKDFPPELHRKLKDEAARHHRSMTRQALALLEQALSSETRNAAELLPKPIKPAKPVPANNVVAIVREGRKSGTSRVPK